MLMFSMQVARRAVQGAPSAVNAAAEEDVELGKLVRRRALVLHDLRCTENPSLSWGTANVVSW